MHYIGKLLCYLSPPRRWLWKQLSLKSILDPTTFVSECPPRAFVWGPATPPPTLQKEEGHEQKQPQSKNIMSLRAAGRWTTSNLLFPFPSYYLSHNIRVPIVGKGQKFSHGKLIHGEKAQWGTHADGFNIPHWFLLDAVSDFTVVPIWWCYFTWKHHPRGCCALPRTLSTVSSSQLPSLLQLLSAECL